MPNPFDVDKFIAHMNDEMSWNGGGLGLSTDKPDTFKEGTIIFDYRCMPGSSVRKDLIEAAKKFGVDIGVKYIDAETYYIGIGKGCLKKKEKKGAKLDYSEAAFKMDKFMSDDVDDIEQYSEALNTLNKADAIEGVKECLTNDSNEELMFQYFPENGTIEGFAEYLVNKHRTK